MKLTTAMLIGLTSAFLVACGNSSGDKSGEQKGVIPQHQLKALEDAKQVEGTLLKLDEERKKALEQ